MILYGIKNCDSVKKARKYFEAHQMDYQFHDFRVDGLDKALITHFLKHVDYNDLINTRGRTWRELSDAEKADLNQTKAIQLMLAHPTIIKRPVLDTHQQIIIGFKESEYKELI